MANGIEESGIPSVIGDGPLDPPKLFGLTIVLESMLLTLSVLDTMGDGEPLLR